MEAEGNLDCNLNDNQWFIVEDTCVLLKPFMFAQKTLEGVCYAKRSSNEPNTPNTTYSDCAILII